MTVIVVPFVLVLEMVLLSLLCVIEQAVLLPLLSSQLLGNPSITTLSPLISGVEKAFTVIANVVTTPALLSAGTSVRVVSPSVLAFVPPIAQR